MSQTVGDFDLAMIEERDLKALHVEAMRSGDLHRERDPGTLFQASTIGALLQGAYDGDLTIAELALHGDTGIGTLNGLDGEMIALDGRFYRADVDGRVNPVDRSERTPFGVVGQLRPGLELDLTEPIGKADLLARIDSRLTADEPSALIRVDGRFRHVEARSVPRQEPPYRPLAEAIESQHRFSIDDAEGTLVGIRFPSYAEGIEVAGYHLHFIDAERARGGHVLDFEILSGRAVIDPSCELHVELPPGIDLASPNLAEETHAAIELAEGR